MNPRVGRVSTRRCTGRAEKRGGMNPALRKDSRMDSMIAAAAFGVVPATVVGIVATIVLAWAWHGRQIDAHPMCRRCGFGLNGRNPLMKPQCPDCGADL